MYRLKYQNLRLTIDSYKMVPIFQILGIAESLFDY